MRWSVCAHVYAYVRVFERAHIVGVKTDSLKR